MEKKLKEVNYAFCDTCHNNDPKDRYGNRPKCDECLKHPYNENSQVPYNYDGPRPGDKSNNRWPVKILGQKWGIKRKEQENE